MKPASLAFAVVLLVGRIASAHPCDSTRAATQPAVTVNTNIAPDGSPLPAPAPSVPDPEKVARYNACVEDAKAKGWPDPRAAQ